MEQFNIFLAQGFFHILDLQGYDHILFLFVICAIYSLKDWKQLLWIITSFTLAHSITLALSALNLIVMDAGLIEFMIAFTIFFTCIENIFLTRLHPYRMVFSFIFGLIHGMGFSRLLKELFMGMELNVLNTLLPFNLGLEAGQLIILTLIMTVIYTLRNFAGLSSKIITYLISIPVAIQSIIWMIQRWPF
ncbi:HupE/UreJ family protein [Flavihumibacter sp. R14]|nr:HupE/UreJ family protein [Flavihumibacter soli]